MTRVSVAAKAGTCFAALLTGVCIIVSPADAAELRGRVLDDTSKAALPGATVVVEDTGATATTNRDGTFVFSNIKPGQHKLSVDYVGYPDKSVAVTVDAARGAEVDIALKGSDTVETVTVTGLRVADRVALQVKRSSDAIVDAVYANDVGKLPDQNVAEAVRRLPGISVANDQGEGRYAIIRGAAPNLANVTINGQTSAAPEPDSRQVKLDDIPASLVGSLTVHKSLTPDLDANAIAGQIDISTISAFDRPSGFTYARFAAGSYNLSGQTPYEVDFTTGHLLGEAEQFGLVVSANFSQRPLESENFGSGGPTWAAVGSQILPNNQQIRDYNLTRTRAGAVANFDWRPTGNLEVFVRSIYSSFSDKETRDRFTVSIPTSVASFTSLGTTGAFTTGGRATRYVRSREEDDHTLTFSSGVKWTEGDNILRLQGTWSQAVKTDPRRDEWQFRTGSSISGSYDLSSFLYRLVPDANAYDATKFPFYQLVHANREATENLYQLRGDYERALGFGDLAAVLKAGAKYTERVKKNDQEQQTFGASSSTLTLASVSFPGKAATYEGRYTFGPRVDYAAAEAYFTANHGTRVCDTSTAGGFKCDINASTSASASGDYQVREKIIAGYVMADLNYGRLTVIPGVRIEATDGQYDATAVSVSSGSPVLTPVSQTRSYTDFFPGINARYDVTSDLVLRGAVTTAIGRPDYNQLPPYVTVDNTSSPVAVTTGNPALKPLKATNYDLSAEYYLPGQGVIALAAFYKDIADPIYAQQYSVTGGTFGGILVPGTASVASFTNAASGSIKGVEINLQSQFDFLPSPFDGFGASANITLIDSQAKGLPNRVGTVPMFSQSKVVGTAQLFYEKDGFSARLAYSYRSKFLDTAGVSAATDVYTMAHGQLDARVAYDLSENVSIFLEAANLNGAQWRRYIGTPTQLYENERYSWSTKAGLQLKL